MILFSVDYSSKQSVGGNPAWFYRVSPSPSLSLSHRSRGGNGSSAHGLAHSSSAAS